MNRVCDDVETNVHPHYTMMSESLWRIEVQPNEREAGAITANRALMEVSRGQSRAYTIDADEVAMS